MHGLYGTLITIQNSNGNYLCPSEEVPTLNVYGFNRKEFNDRCLLRLKCDSETKFQLEAIDGMLSL